MLSWVKRKLHGTDTPLIQRFALHAKQMRIQAPDGTDLNLEAPYSKDMEVMLKHLNKYNQ
jgi:23S rRNA pseudouridine955/2504/2580 synthase